MINRLKTLLCMFAFLACLISISFAQQATQEAPAAQQQKFDIPSTDDGLPGVGPNSCQITQFKNHPLILR